MTDPIDTIITAVVQGGIKFLWDEAKDVVDKYRQQHSKGKVPAQELPLPDGVDVPRIPIDLKRNIDASLREFVVNEIDTLRTEIGTYQEWYNIHRKRIAEMGDYAPIFDRNELKRYATLLVDKSQVLKQLLEQVYQEKIELAGFPEVRQ